MRKPVLLLSALLIFVFNYTKILAGNDTTDPVEARAEHRLSYNNPDLIVDLGVGLWATPLPMDWDGDGDNDLLVSTSDVPYNGVYFFENNGTGVFRSGKRLGEGKKNITVSYLDGEIRVCQPNIEFREFKTHLFDQADEIGYEQDFYAGRTNQWKFADCNGDGLNDLVFGVSDWREYGWDNAFDSSGNWTHGPLHGYVYWAKNIGTNENPKYEKAQQVYADDKPVDVYGCPSPNFVDWDEDGDLDLICGEFLDRITFFENTGDRTNPKYARGRYLEADGETIRMELEMMQVVVCDWDRDGDPDVIVGQEDGRVAWIENIGEKENGLPILNKPVFFKQRAADVKCGALVTPCSFDWDGDGDEDLVCGNTAGFLEWTENLGGDGTPRWNAPKRLGAGGHAFRVMAGPNLSIQGPAEAKWGYTVPYVADWDMDGLPDIVVNSIVGKVEWFRNIGRKTAPKLAPAQPVRVAWSGTPPKPEWNWWSPGPTDLAVQWRTRPIVWDVNKDGLNDLIVIDHEGYLSYFERVRKENGLILMPGKRIFHLEDGSPLRLSDREAGGSGRRKIDLVDWDNDGDLDILINSPRESPQETRSIAYYENIAEKGEFVFRYRGDITNIRLEGHTTSPTTVDWDGDGIRDLLVGAEDGFLYYFHRGTAEDLTGEK